MATTMLPRAAARARRVDLRVLIALLLLLAGVLGTFAAVRRLAAHTPVLVMAREVQAGATIGAGDVRLAELGLAPGVATLPPEARDRVVGHVATVPLAAGQVLAPDQVTQSAPVGADQVAMSVALPAEQAAGGMVRAGDQVEVIATPRSAEGEGRAVVLLASVRVLAVGTSADPSGGGKLVVSLAVPRQRAPDVAQAAAGRVDLAVLGQQGGR
jgi:Flp pilus assembly protein CpaB